MASVQMIHFIVIVHTSMFIMASCNNNLRHLQEQDDEPPSNYGSIFGIYLAYFIGLLFLTYLLDAMEVFDGLLERLGESAYKKFLVYSKLRIMLREHHRDSERSSTVFDRNSARSNIEGEINSSKSSTESKTTPMQICCNVTCSKIFGCWNPPISPFSSEFFRHILDGHCYFGCQDILFPGGIFTICGFQPFKASFPTGYLVRKRIFNQPYLLYFIIFYYIML
jgi:hypothetical protein